MTNDKMWQLVHKRILAFRKRVFEPLKLCEDGDVEQVERFMKWGFNKTRKHSEWLTAFFEAIEKTETEIVLHKKTPKSFEHEVNILYSSYFYKY